MQSKFLYSLSAILIFASVATGQNVIRKSAKTDTRAIRTDVPLTNSIQKAMEAGTRNFSGTPGPNYWQLETNFNIEASIDPSTQVLTGSETIEVVNNSKDELKQIVLRLDHNIFRAFVPRGSSVPAETTEGMVITKILVDGQEVDLSRTTGRRRNTEPKLRAIGLNQTVGAIILKDPIQPNSKASVEIEWHTKLPGGTGGRGHRMTQRWDSTLFQPTQWFPRLAKYDDLRGWETNVYLGPAEFFNNFGKFDVKITAPGGWIVSGTGVLQNPEEVLTQQARNQLSKVLDSDDEITIVGKDDRGPGKATVNKEELTWHFKADYVNDFAWATAKDFMWTATRATIPGKGPVPIHMVYLPKRADKFKRAGELSRHALEFYSDLWAPYPFPQLTLQDGPSAGMEYPMVINSNQGAADHEVAHQWWPMMLGTNETRYGWMDEGFNTYMNILSAQHRKGDEPNLDGRGRRYGSTSGSEDEAAMMWSSNYGGTGYGFQTYSKAAMMLSMLGGIVGDEEVQKAMSDYTKTWAFKHPSPWDYIFFMNNALGEDLEWFWYYWLWTTESVEGSIKEVKSNGDQTLVTIRQEGQMPSPVILKVEFEEKGPKIKSMENAEILDDNTALVTFPVDVWFSGSKEYEATLSFGKRKVSKITFDPYGRFPDKNAKDNVWENK